MRSASEGGMPHALKEPTSCTRQQSTSLAHLLHLAHPPASSTLGPSTMPAPCPHHPQTSRPTCLHRSSSPRDPASTTSCTRQRSSWSAALGSATEDVAWPRAARMAEAATVCGGCTAVRCEVGATWACAQSSAAGVAWPWAARTAEAATVCRGGTAVRCDIGATWQCSS